MLYLTCPTCGYCLGNKQYEFEKDKKVVCDNPKLTAIEKEQKVKKLINDLGLRRYC